MTGMRDTLVAALWLALPVILGGIGHVVVIKLRLAPGLAALPLDFGLTLRGRRLWGDNKTVRGALAMPLLTAAAAAACDGLGLVDTTTARPPALLWGLLLGVGYILGELPNSALKRQLDIAPGAAAPGVRRRLFWLVDQVDSLLGIVVVTAIAGWPLSPPLVLTLIGVALVVHPAVAGLMVLLGLKSRVG